MADYDESVYWPHFKRAGMLTPVQWLKQGTAGPVAGDVLFRSPDAVLLSGYVSREYAMEYRHADFPTLLEGDQVLLGAAPDELRFRVREDPTIADGNPSGFFRIAILTRVL